MNRNVIFLGIFIIILFLVGILHYNNDNSAKVKLVFLELKNADCSVIQYENINIMIDTGESKDKEKIDKEMKKMNIQSIDYLILTHPDKDHIGNIEYLLDNYNVKNIIQNNYDKGTELQKEMNKKIENIKVNNIIVGEEYELNINNLFIKIKPPKKEYEDSNNNSLIITLKYNEYKVLYAADIQEERMNDIMSELENVDILKYPYHGRKNKYTKTFIEKIQPKYAIITGENPDEQVINELEKIKCKIRLTSEQKVEIKLK